MGKRSRIKGNTPFLFLLKYLQHNAVYDIIAVYYGGIMQYEIDLDELNNQEKDSYVLVDIRDEKSFTFGHINNALNIPAKAFVEKITTMPRDKQYYIYCHRGNKSLDLAQTLQQKGYNVYSLKGGYAKWVESEVKKEINVVSALKAEDSIRNKFRRQLLSKFCKADKQYNLIAPNDKIAVCISGGKDSMCMAKLFQEVQKHNKIPFSLEFIAMDPGYNKENRKLLEENAKKLNIPLHIFETDIFESVYRIGSSPCYMCARMRRGSLYGKAKQLGCNKIALGHHYDDVIETILMGVLYGAQVQTMMPKLHSNNFEGMELIRPLYLIREEDIKKWRDYNNLEFLQCACKLSEEFAGQKDLVDKMGKKRKKVKALIAKLSKEEQQVEENIFRSVEGVNLATIISYKDKQGKIHSFLDDYDN